MKLQLAIGFALFSSVSACTDQGASAASRGGVSDSSGGTVTLASRPYRATSLSAVGSIAGTVHPGGETLVWIDDIASGKPIGEIRRHTVTIENGKFVPAIQDVPVGTTINVFTRDRVGHSATFMRGSESVAEIRTMDAGQVVPSETIASRAGLVEAKMTNPPGATAYIAAFDHPYHTVTGASGSFRIDSLPPGTYTIKMWRAGMSEPESQRVVVSAGGVGQITFGIADSVSLADSSTTTPHEGRE
jgi:plastocyanin